MHGHYLNKMCSRCFISSNSHIYILMKVSAVLCKSLQKVNYPKALQHLHEIILPNTKRKGVFARYGQKRDRKKYNILQTHQDQRTCAKEAHLNHRYAVQELDLIQFAPGPMLTAPTHSPSIIACPVGPCEVSAFVSQIDYKIH